MQDKQTPHQIAADSMAALPFTSFAHESGNVVFFSDEADIDVFGLSEEAFEDFEALMKTVARSGATEETPARVFHDGWLYKAGFLPTGAGGRMWNVEKVEPVRSQAEAEFSFDGMDW